MLKNSNGSSAGRREMPRDRAQASTPDGSLFSAFHAPGAPVGAAAIRQDLVAGGRAVRRAFLESPLRYAPRNATLIRLGDCDAPVILLRSGFAFRSCVLSDGRRAIVD